MGWIFSVGMQNFASVQNEDNKDNHDNIFCCEYGSDVIVEMLRATSPSFLRNSKLSQVVYVVFCLYLLSRKILRLYSVLYGRQQGQSRQHYCCEYGLIVIVEMLRATSPSFSRNLKLSQVVYVVFCLYLLNRKILRLYSVLYGRQQGQQ